MILKRKVSSIDINLFPVPPSLQHGNQHLLGIVDNLFALKGRGRDDHGWICKSDLTYHDDCQLLCQLDEAASIPTLDMNDEGKIIMYHVKTSRQKRYYFTSSFLRDPKMCL